jgi:hypothetical protein
MMAPIVQQEFFKSTPAVGRDGNRSPDKFASDPNAFKRYKTDVVQYSEHKLGMRPEKPEVRRALAEAINDFQANKVWCC